MGYSRFHFRRTFDIGRQVYQHGIIASNLILGSATWPSLSDEVYTPSQKQAIPLILRFSLRWFHSEPSGHLQQYFAKV